jgi:hypothetical protein
MLIDTNISEPSEKYQIATTAQQEYIDTMKENIKDKIIARHKLDNPSEKNKTWKNLAYRYTPTLYKMVNDECKDAFGIDKCVEVLTISNRYEKLDSTDASALEEVRLYYKTKMYDWIKKNDCLKVEDVVDFHNEIFKM